MKTSDPEWIVWPPVVVVYNTFYDKTEDDTTEDDKVQAETTEEPDKVDAHRFHRREPMGNPALKKLYDDFLPSKAKQLFNARGAPGIAFLQFTADDRGYYLANFLNNALEEEGRRRYGWQCRNVEYPKNERGEYKQYGYLATCMDMDTLRWNGLGQKFVWEKVSRRTKVDEPLQRKLEMSNDIERLREERARHDEELAEQKRRLEDDLEMQNMGQANELAEIEHEHQAKREKFMKSFEERYKTLMEERRQKGRDEWAVQGLLLNRLKEQEARRFQLEVAMASTQETYNSRLQQLEERRQQLYANEQRRERQREKEVRGEKDRREQFNAFVQQILQERTREKQEMLRELREKREKALLELDCQLAEGQRRCEELEREWEAAERERERLRREEEEEANRRLESQPRDKRVDCACCTTRFATHDQRPAYTCQAHAQVVCMACALEAFNRRSQKGETTSCPECGAPSWVNSLPELDRKRGRKAKTEVNPKVQPRNSCMNCTKMFTKKDHRRGLPPCGHAVNCMSCLAGQPSCLVAGCRLPITSVLPCPSTVFLS